MSDTTNVNTAELHYLRACEAWALAQSEYYGLRYIAYTAISSAERMAADEKLPKASMAKERSYLLMLNAKLKMQGDLK